MLRPAILALIILATPFGSLADTNHGIVPAGRIYVVDGDTIRISDTTYRLVGFDTPETWKPQCEYEEALGNAATDRLTSLLDASLRVELVVLPGRDRYDRSLARLLIDGQDVGAILISERLARPYENGPRQGWCG